MKKCNLKLLLIGICFIILFILWTILISVIDVQQIGPNGSRIGFATLNGFIHNLLGVHIWLYVVTDWLGLIPIAFMFGFAILGLCQWIKRKNIFKVDYKILILGFYYILVFAIYVLFEYLVINYRPVLINGYLEASYPSSTTMLCACVMPSVIYLINNKVVNWILYIFTAFMIVGRFISGVHWITDIIGGLLISIGLFLIYYPIVNVHNKKEE